MQNYVNCIIGFVETWHGIGVGIVVGWMLRVLL